MSLITMPEKPVSETPITEQDYYAGITFLREQCKAFQKFEADMIQLVVDNLYAVNCLIVSSIPNSSYVHQLVPTERLRQIQQINTMLMERIRNVEAGK